MKNKSDLELCDRETLLSCDVDKETWEVYTSDPAMMNRLDKIAEAYEVDSWGKKYKLRFNQISMGKGTKLSAEERERRSKHMKRVRAKQIAQAS